MDLPADAPIEKSGLFEAGHKGDQYWFFRKLLKMSLRLLAVQLLQTSLLSFCQKDWFW